jgi:ATP phosphoribosyltransferase
MAAEKENIEIAKLQKEIESYLSLGNTDIIFDYVDHGQAIRLNVITVNPRHNQSFLFHYTEGHDKIDALKEMVNYVKVDREKYNSYTIQWTVRGGNELQTSYFRAKDIQEAIDKLHFSRDPNSIQIFSVVLNPIS